MHGDFAEEREKTAARTANLCTQCGLCNAVCPSRLPLCQIMPLLEEYNHEEK
ncbi:MAG: 4Fe-4S dicluster domain-containing protein [Treponema sp.]|nr:4Fe-4S dicluster domain-containing protein [Treponema sp.]